MKKAVTFTALVALTLASKAKNYLDDELGSLLNIENSLEKVSEFSIHPQIITTIAKILALNKMLESGNTMQLEDHLNTFEKATKTFKDQFERNFHLESDLQNGLNRLSFIVEELLDSYERGYLDNEFRTLGYNTEKNKKDPKKMYLTFDDNSLFNLGQLIEEAKKNNEEALDTKSDNAIGRKDSFLGI